MIPEHLVPTSLERESKEQRRWHLLPHYSGSPLFDRLVDNEFLAPELHQKRQLHFLNETLHYAQSQIPFYQKQAYSSAYPLENLQDINRIPILSKQQVLDHFELLQCRNLPKGEKPAGVTSSSGTTGRPVKVAQTRRSMEMFNVFWQRQARWFRQDPYALSARIRLAETLPRLPDGSLLRSGTTYTRSRWSHIGGYFFTGPEIGCSLDNSRDWHLNWLQEHQPAYLQSFPGIFEELALANECKQPCESLKALIGVASLLTSSMRSVVERVFEIPIFQNYGMNEIGIVAARCNAKRYHIHSEHCHVELLDHNDQPVKTGEIGRIIISTFRNPAMPLLRYDTGDMATAVEGECSCGRTLPSIGEIVGRYRRFAHLPEGTRTQYTGIFDAIESMPTNLLKNLRQYQVHQGLDQHFEVRLITNGKLPAEFHHQILDAWIKVNGIEKKDWLSFKLVEKIDGAPGGKILEFSSDFFPNEDRELTRIEIK